MPARPPLGVVVAHVLNLCGGGGADHRAGAGGGGGGGDGGHADDVRTFMRADVIKKAYRYLQTEIADDHDRNASVRVAYSAFRLATRGATCCATRSSTCSRSAFVLATCTAAATCRRRPPTATTVAVPYVVAFRLATCRATCCATCSSSRGC